MVKTLITFVQNKTGQVFSVIPVLWLRVGTDANVYKLNGSKMSMQERFEKLQVQ
jgi:hypothetical protein